MRKKKIKKPPVNGGFYLLNCLVSYRCFEHLNMSRSSEFCRLEVFSMKLLGISPVSGENLTYMQLLRLSEFFLRPARILLV